MSTNDETTFLQGFQNIFGNHQCIVPGYVKIISSWSNLAPTTVFERTLCISKDSFCSIIRHLYISTPITRHYCLSFPYLGRRSFAYSFLGYIPMPHGSYDATFVRPILNRSNVTVINPVCSSYRCRQMNIVETVDSRIFSSPSIHLFGHFRIPGNIGHHSWKCLRLKIIQ